MNEEIERDENIAFVIIRELFVLFIALVVYYLAIAVAALIAYALIHLVIYLLSAYAAKRERQRIRDSYYN